MADKPEIAFVVRYTRHEYEWLQAQAGIAPPDRMPYAERLKMIARAIAQAHKQGIRVIEIELTAQQVLDFARITEATLDVTTELGAQLAVLIGTNRLQRGEIK